MKGYNANVFSFSLLPWAGDSYMGWTIYQLSITLKCLVVVRDAHTIVNVLDMLTHPMMMITIVRQIGSCSCLFLM